MTENNSSTSPELANYENKRRLVRDRVRGVVGGHHAGLYLYGPGGGGKPARTSAS
jgi:hypothetical protein